MGLLDKVPSSNLYKKAESSALFKRVPLSICLGLSVAIILDTGVQIFWKMAVDSTANESVFGTFLHPLFWLVVALFLLQLANWLKVLENADLSYSQPITSLSYISVGVLSALILHEHISIPQILGITLVLAGVWFISRTDPNTVSSVTGIDPSPITGGGLK
ncbi:MAG TPA: EamA family transporter [Drouetiella sp.]